MIKKLPEWLVTKGTPAFYDTESATALEMVYKLHGKVNEIITASNEFIEATEKGLAEFMNSTNQDEEVFRTEMRQHFQDFIDTINLKMMSQENIIANVNQAIDKAVTDAVGDLNSTITGQNNKIDNAISEMNETVNNAVSYMEENLESTVGGIINEKFEAGQVTVNAEDTQARADIQTINETVSTHEQEITELQNDISNINVNSGSANARFTAIETMNTEQSNQISELQDKNRDQDVLITDHGTRISNNSVVIESLKGRIETLETTLEDVDSAIDEILGV